jgi:hypothetical protein
VIDFWWLEKVGFTLFLLYRGDCASVVALAGGRGSGFNLEDEIWVVGLIYIGLCWLYEIIPITYFTHSQTHECPCHDSHPIITTITTTRKNYKISVFFIKNAELTN